MLSGVGACVNVNLVFLHGKWYLHEAGSAFCRRFRGQSGCVEGVEHKNALSLQSGWSRVLAS